MLKLGRKRKHKKVRNENSGGVWTLCGSSRRNLHDTPPIGLPGISRKPHDGPSLNLIEPVKWSDAIEPGSPLLGTTAGPASDQGFAASLGVERRPPLGPSRLAGPGQAAMIVYPSMSGQQEAQAVLDTEAKAAAAEPAAGDALYAVGNK